MSTIYKNLTYSELVKLAPKDKPFQIKHYGDKNIPQFLWAHFEEDEGDIKLLSQSRFMVFFSDFFDLIIDPWDNFERDELKVGDTVEAKSGVKYTILKIEHNRFATLELLDKSNKRYNVPLIDLIRIGNIAKPKETIQIGSDTYELTDEFKEQFFKIAKTLKKIN